ncbi:hypothetical protein Nepgr_006522 [Nepenthes gracilis]|uniref:protein-serine/threonine phosphatase n=1 Tax=Nepenthes gracilis TaxID=150966 RepID=A0AAD3S5Y3_NEPGR|nr:hypothetical protein Nepgr_006522 [Nepenthes gracilis]
MAAGADLSSPYTVLEGSYKKGNASAIKDERTESLSNFIQRSNGKPPRHISVVRPCMSSVRLSAMIDTDADAGSICNMLHSDGNVPLPTFRSGSCAERGPRQYMEDEHICIDNLHDHLLKYQDASLDLPSPGAFYGVFDGHGGIDAAYFVRNRILKFIVQDPHFPLCVEKAVHSAFVKVDYAFADDSSLDISSGTTALIALSFGREMLVANAGDCRAVLGRRGRAIELSRDHKPNCTSEKLRIEGLGGVVYDGYLNGQLSVARALGDWHMKGQKGSACPLSAEPELQETILTEEDEFLILGCDGLWDVMSSQCAVTIARKELMLHNDPERCSRELVREALKRNTCDNLTVIVVCFSPDPPRQIEIPPSRVGRSISAEGLNLLKGVLDHRS